MEACRACLARDQDMVALDEPFVNAYNILTNLNIALMDAMPQLVCQKCKDTVMYYSNFREKCISTEITLQGIMLEKIKSETTELEEKKISNKENEKEIKVKKEKLEEYVNEEHLEEYADNDYADSNFIDHEDDMLLSRVKEEKNKNEKKRKKKKQPKKKKLTLKEENHKVENFSCGLCELQFNEQVELSQHIESHKTCLKCGLCKSKAYNWPNLIGHRFTHIPQKEYRCHICNKMRHTPLNMEHHYMNEHFDGEKELLKCVTCNKNYDTPKKLKRHLQRMHPKNGTLLNCDHCSKVFVSSLQLKSHLRSSHGTKKTYVCDICGFSCSFSGGLQQHKIWRHTPSRVTCKTCCRIFAAQAQYDRHKCGAKPKICPVCGKEVKSKFANHVAKHSGKPHKCPRCPAAFSERQSLKAHLNRHDGIRTKQCEFCPRTFYTQAVLEKHRRIHTGEKPFVCKVCNKGFTGNHNLRVHMKVHGEYLIVKRDKAANLVVPSLPAVDCADKDIKSAP